MLQPLLLAALWLLPLANGRAINRFATSAGGKTVTCADLNFDVKYIAPLCTGTPGYGTTLFRVGNDTDGTVDSQSLDANVTSSATIYAFLQQTQFSAAVGTQLAFQTPPRFPSALVMVKFKFGAVRVLINTRTGLVSSIGLYFQLFTNATGKVGGLELGGSLVGVVQLTHLDTAVQANDPSRLDIEFWCRAQWRFANFLLPVTIKIAEGFRDWRIESYIAQILLSDVFGDLGASQFLNTPAFNLLSGLSTLGLRRVNTTILWRDNGTVGNSFLFRFSASPVLFDLEPFSTGIEVALSRVGGQSDFQACAIAFNPAAITKLIFKIVGLQTWANVTVFDYLPATKPALFIASAPVLVASDVNGNGYDGLFAAGMFPRLGRPLSDGATLAMEISKPTCADKLPQGHGQLCVVLTKIFEVNGIVDHVTLMASKSTSNQLTFRAEVGFLHVGIESRNMSLLLQSAGISVDVTLSGGVVALVYSIVTLDVADKVSLQFDTAIGISSVGNLQLHLQMAGMWQRAFGIAMLSIGDLVAVLELNVVVLTVPAFAFGGKIWIGDPAECARLNPSILATNSDTSLAVFTADVEPLCLQVEGYIGIDATNYQNNWFLGGVNSLTAGQLARLFLRLPSADIAPIWDQTGFPNGMQVSLALQQQILPGGDIVRSGFLMRGDINFLNVLQVAATVIVTPLNSLNERLFINITSRPMTFGSGAVTILRREDLVDQGPVFIMDASVSVVTLPQLEIYAESYFKVYEVVKAYGHIALSHGMMYLDAKLVIVGYFNANVTLFGALPSLQSTLFQFDADVNLNYGNLHDTLIVPIMSKVAEYLNNSQSAFDLVSAGLKQNELEADKAQQSVCGNINATCGRQPPMCKKWIFKLACKVIKLVVDASCWLACRVAEGSLELYKGLLIVSRALVSFTGIVVNAVARFIDFTNKYPLLHMLSMSLSALADEQFQRGHLSLGCTAEVLNVFTLTYSTVRLPMVGINVNSAPESVISIGPELLAASLDSSELTPEVQRQVLPLMVRQAATGPVIAADFPSDLAIECARESEQVLNAHAAATAQSVSVGISTGCKTGGTATLTYVDTIHGKKCHEIIQRNWTATDYCGKTTWRIQVIAIRDTQGPVFPYRPPARITSECSVISTLADVVDSAQSVIAVDACYNDPWPTVTETIVDLPSRFPPGCRSRESVRRWTSQDVCGNVGESYEQVIAVMDTRPPYFTTTIPATQNMTLIQWRSLKHPVASDDCGSAPIRVGHRDSIKEGNCTERAQISRTWYAVDACGNENTETTLVCVDWSQDPVLKALEDITQLSLICLRDLTASEATISVQVGAIRNVNMYSVVLDGSSAPACKKTKQTVSAGNQLNLHHVTTTQSNQDDFTQRRLLNTLDGENPAAGLATTASAVVSLLSEIDSLELEPFSDRNATLKSNWPVYSVLSVSDSAWTHGSTTEELTVDITGKIFTTEYTVILTIKSAMSVFLGRTVVVRTTSSQMRIRLVYVFPAATDFQCDLSTHVASAYVSGRSASSPRRPISYHVIAPNAVANFTNCSLSGQAIVDSAHVTGVLSASCQYLHQ